MAYVISDECVSCGTCADECPVGKKSPGSHTGAAGYDNDALRGQRIGMGGHFLIQVISPQSGTADEIPGDLFRKISDLQSTGGKICK